MKVLYFCEGYTDIRFVVGLSEMCDLTMAIPERQLHESGLAGPARRKRRARARRCDQRRPAGLPVAIVRVSSSQASVVRRGAVAGNGTGIAERDRCRQGAARTPVVCYLGTSPVEYFHCRRVRGQVGPLRGWASETFLASRDEGDRRAFVGRGDDRTVSRRDGGASCAARVRGLLLRHRHEPLQARVSLSERASPSRAPAVSGRASS